MKPYRHWFEQEDGAPFERTLAGQLIGLELLAARCRGRSVLDLGCAEGAIGKWLLEQGAARYHGMEVHPDRVAAARRLLPGCVIDCRDLNNLAPPPTPDGKLHSFDIVLALAIAHKLRDPAAFLRAAAARCRELMVLRLPGPVINDRRSNFVMCDPVAVLARGFRPIQFPKGDREEWMVYLERANPSGVRP